MAEIMESEPIPPVKDLASSGTSYSVLPGTNLLLVTAVSL
jgi:hypothetical protein